MSEVDTFSKTRFNVVTNHFKELVDNLEDAETSKNVIAGFNNLLNNFHSLFKDSEKKTNKIRQLIAEKAKLKIDLEKKIQEKNLIITELEQYLSNLKIQTGCYNDERQELWNKIDYLNGYISYLKQENNDKSETYYVEVQVDKNPLYISNTDDTKKLKIENVDNTPLTEDRLLDSNNQIIKQIETVFKYQIGLIQTKVRGLKAHVRFNLKKIKRLQQQLESKNQFVNDCSERMSNFEKQKLEMEDHFLKTQESYENKLKDLTTRLDELSSIKLNMDNSIINLKNENKSLSSELQEKVDYIEDTHQKLLSLAERENSLNDQMEILEKYLAMNRKRMSRTKTDTYKFRKIVSELNKDITQQRVESEVKALAMKEAMKESEKIEEKKLVEYYKNMLAMRDKNIDTLKKEIIEHNRHQIKTEKELAKKSLSNSALLEKISSLKKSLNDVSTDNRKLRLLLKEADFSVDKLKSEMKSQKIKYHDVVKERNKFQALYDRQSSIQFQRRFERELLARHQDVLIKTLKLKEAKLNEILTKRRLKWKKKFQV